MTDASVLEKENAFTQALPKLELHAHLTGSISRRCLHDIWEIRKRTDPSFELDDPLAAIPQGEGRINIVTFFPIFDKYIYALINTLESLRHATNAVLQDFHDDGVAYIELRTTPRALMASKATKEDYVRTVLETMQTFVDRTKGKMSVNLILSIDRGCTLEEAMKTVDLALKLRHQSSADTGALMTPSVVGLDLCGNPMKGPITHLSPAFIRAGEEGLPLTLHFAEVPASSTDGELDTLISWGPSRLGHVIHVPERVKQEIERRKLGLELCLSCNVQAGLLIHSTGRQRESGGVAEGRGGFIDHHLGSWRGKGCPIVLGTDDVGIFESKLSQEYGLAMKHFGLCEKECVELCRRAVEVTFAREQDKERLRALISRFEETTFALCEEDLLC